VNRVDIEGLIAKLVDMYWTESNNDKFIPGVTRVPVTKKYYTSSEIMAVISSALDGNFTSGRYVEMFEQRLRTYVGTRYAMVTNSGSSANLLAVLAASEETLDRCFHPEVITMAVGFPTTIAPIYQAGMIPNFVDIVLPTYGPNMEQLEEAIGPNTVGIILAHTLGNPFNVELVTNLAKQHDLFFIEDVCDALGAKYNGKMVGTFGDASTFSFYPAHHITTGEGGAVLTNSADIKLAVESYRDWGRDCWCETGHDATCGKRYSQQFGDLPYGYDHKYVYTRLGYNLKMTEMQAAIGAVQMIKLPWFIEQRQRNFARLHDYIMMMHEDFFIIPKAIEDSEPSWFGFPLTIRGGAPFTRSSLIDYLDRARIDSRLLFAGNMVRQPAMINMEYEAEDLTVSDKVMNDTFWLGVHPSLTTEMIDYMIETIGCFIKEL
jgi:CDP-6-deoxy-D-xylo-4-hexulose-3-dehydrase